MSQPIKRRKNGEYEKALEYIKTLKEGDEVSVSAIQRHTRLGYSSASDILLILADEGHLEPFKRWLGTTINGVKQSGEYRTFYKIPNKTEISQ